MSYSNQSQINVFAGLQGDLLVEYVLFTVLCSLPCCLFLFINGMMLFTLRSKAVFRETPRYNLLYNVLLADTALLAQSQLLYALAASGLRLTYPVCGVLTMLTILSNEISPLTLMVMSLERYVAVCYPLRHAQIITITKTAAAICMVWAFSLLNVCMRVLLLLESPLEDNLQMATVCTDTAMMIGPLSYQYNLAYTCVLFVLVAVVISFSYISVVLAARSASVDQASARKARNTLLLHLVQLGLSLCSTLHSVTIISLSKTRDKVTISRLKRVLYVCVYLFPRCLRVLIYGLKDQTIRPVLMFYLCCCLQRAKARHSNKQENKVSL
ncbi:odorant receptor 131-2-like [Thalassophryne amazonica]|uniref:odorant receptor 131-2-like n=1 Tax=Thalassophryne amazonica TaxID=390379 RepID=UPI0014719A8E|nr:odorant receptor 131-2-like [Thalassophryne amazonica]